MIQFYVSFLHERFEFSAFRVAVNDTSKHCLWTFIKFSFAKDRTEINSLHSSDNTRAELDQYTLTASDGSN